jgi:L-alanine-DL-glutamate epimerase-like enolase superfamily enzyme
MKISHVDAFLMSFVLPEPLRLRFWGGERVILKRDAMLIRVTTDTGLRGYAPGPAHEAAATDVRDVIAPFLAGRDPRERLHFPPDWPAGVETSARAVEIALMEVVARAEGCALSEIAARSIAKQRVRDRIKLYGSAGMYMSPDGYAEEAAAVQAMGFPAYKMRPALGPERDLDALARMRRATGPGFGLMVDAHSWWRMGDRSYTRNDVAAAADAFAPHAPVWLEEPLPPEDHDAYRWLRSRGPLTIATGEHEHDAAGFLDLIETHAADIVQMDVCCQGGLPMLQAVADGAAAKRLRFAFHSWGTMLEVLTAAHLGVLWPETVVEWLECPCYANAGRAGMYPFPLSDEILTDPLPMEDGYLVAPGGPGLGIDVDERVIERYPFVPGPWSFFHIESPAQTIAVTSDHSRKWIPSPRNGG